MRILLLPFGSHGDVNPFLGLGAALQRRGHEVLVGACAYFQELVGRSRLPFVEVGTREEYLAAAAHPDIWHPLRSFGHLFRSGIEPAMRLQYELIAEQAAAGPLLVVANSLGFGARIAQEKLGIPLVTVHLQPSILWSGYDSPALPNMVVGPGIPRWFKNLQFWIGERFVIDRAVTGATNGFRHALGLPPMRRTTQWWNSPECVLGLFPEWFAPPQPDWPQNVQLTQFPLWDEEEIAPPQPELEAFLAAGSPPIVFTPGSANQHAVEFFAAAVEACHRLDHRGLLLTRFPEQVPHDLPPGVRHFTFEPLSRLLPRAAALVHHGGVGTLAQGLRAGKPQLVMPMAHDQPDNAARLRRLGVGLHLPPARFEGVALTAALRTLLSSSEVVDRCRELADRFHGIDPFSQACAAIERLGMAHGLAAEPV